MMYWFFFYVTKFFSLKVTALYSDPSLRVWCLGILYFMKYGIYRLQVFSLITLLGNSLTVWSPDFEGKFDWSLKCKFLGTRLVGKVNNLVRLN